jgi:hypothetical protein
MNRVAQDVCQLPPDTRANYHGVCVGCHQDAKSKRMRGVFRCKSIKLGLGLAEGMQRGVATCFDGRSSIAVVVIEPARDDGDE